MPIQSKQQPPYYKSGINVKEYTVLLTQSGTDAPTAKELINTLGPIILTRNGAGDYQATLANAFTTDKTATTINDNSENNIKVISTNLWDTDRIRINTTDDGTPTDDILNNTVFTIKIYN